MFPLDTRQHFCVVQVTERWHRLPRSCGVSSWGIFKSLLNTGLGTLLWVALLEQGWDQKDPEVPPSLNLQ